MGPRFVKGGREEKLKLPTSEKTMKIMFALLEKAWYNSRDAGNSPGCLPFPHSVLLPASVSLRFLRCCRRVRDLRNVGCL